MDEFKIRISGELDVNSTIKQIQKKLKEQSVNLDVDLKIKGFDGKGIGQDLQKQIDSVINSLNSKINKLNSTLNSNQFSKSSKNPMIESQKQAIQDLLTKYSELRNQANNLQNELTQTDNIDKDSFKNLRLSISETNQQFFNLTQNVKSTKDGILSDLQELNLSQGKIQFDNQITDWLNKNTNLSGRLRNQVLEVQKQIESADSATLKKLKSEFKSVTSEAKALGQTGLSSVDKLKSQIQKFSQWMSLTTVIASFANDIRKSVIELKEMDTILTEISKTSNRSAENIKNLGKQSFGVANEYGVTVGGYLTGIQEMSRAGYQGKNAEELAELSLLTQSAGDVDSTVANDYILATDAAFDLKGNVKELNKILDGQNQITNRNAVSMSDMAQATGEAASMASQYGVKVEELSSLIATATSKTRESGSETGNAVKGIFVNLQDTTNKEITRTFDEIGVSMTKVVDGSEKLKTPIELLHELSDVFTSLDEGDVKRANILSNIGGKWHANTLSAILSDWDTYEKILNDYSDSEGSAYEEMLKTAESWEGRLNKLSNSWTNLVSKFADSDNIKLGISLLQDLSDGAVWATENLGAMPTAITAITAAVASYKSLKGEGRGKMIPLNKYALVDTGGNTERVYIIILYKQGCLGKTA